MDGRTGTIFYDFIDPISYLLLLELERAGPRLTSEVEWAGFELRPPPTPLVTRADPTLRSRWTEATELARRFHVALDPPDLVPWTRKAHELVCHAAGYDRRTHARRAIFEAYMLQRADIGRIDVLVDIARTLELDATETKAVLDVDRFEAQVAARREAASIDGIRTTPSVVRGTRRLEGFHNRDALGTFLHL